MNETEKNLHEISDILFDINAISNIKDDTISDENAIFPCIINDVLIEEKVKSDKPILTKTSNFNTLKLNDNSQAHFLKFIKGKDGELGLNDNKNSRLSSGERVSAIRNNTSSVANILYDNELSIKYKEALNNLNIISQSLLREVENGRIGYLLPVKKTIKDTLVDKINNAKIKIAISKRDIFFSLVKHTQNFLNIK